MSDEEWTKRVDTQGSLLAVAEVSLQVPNGNRALPVPLPIWLKKVSVTLLGVEMDGRFAQASPLSSYGL